MSLFLMSFPFLYTLNSLHLLLLYTLCKVCLPVKETAEIETGMAEKSSQDQANIRQKLGLVWINRKKISQIIKRLLLLTVLPLNYFMLLICGRVGGRRKSFNSKHAGFTPKIYINNGTYVFDFQAIEQEICPKRSRAHICGSTGQGSTSYILKKQH